MSGTGVRRPVDAAVAQARRVVGLYGDPDVSWSIVLALGLAEPGDPDELAAAAARLVSDHPHLGRVPAVERFAPGGEQELITRLADTAYGDQDPLLRVALGQDARTLVVAAHHGAVDGLGLLGVTALLLGVEVTSSARGIARTAEPTGFLRSSLGRLREAMWRPPARLRAGRPGRSGEGGDHLVAHPVTSSAVGSAGLVAAAVAAVRDWNGGHLDPRRRLVVAMGLSRRPGSPTPGPDRDTAYVRLPAEGIHSLAEARAVVADTLPEPAFPVTDGGGLAPRIVRLLSDRLGSTVLVSNLGRLESPALTSVRFYPVPTGPAGTAIGLATVGDQVRVTTRVRRDWFTAADAEAIGALVARCLAELGQ